MQITPATRFGISEFHNGQSGPDYVNLTIRPKLISLRKCRSGND
jgi:hypothetical protein